MFSFQGFHPVRVQVIDGEPWFVAMDVCSAVGIKHSASAMRALDNDDKGVHSMHTPGGQQQMAIVSEPGLYTLILRCRDAVKPGTQAWHFRKWVTGEVLPTIRKTGRYLLPDLAEMELAPKDFTEPLSRADMEEIAWIIGDISRCFRCNNKWVTGIWFALRRATGTPSPAPFTVNDLPVVVSELRRILKATLHASTVSYEYEHQILYEIVREGSQGEPLPESIQIKESSIPARYQLALERLERIDTKLPEQVLVK
jgi:prophage antirepressor-like protein